MRSEMKALLQMSGVGPSRMVDHAIRLWAYGNQYGIDIDGDGYFAAFDSAESMIGFLEEARLAIMRDAEGKATSPGPGVLPVASPLQFVEDNANRCPCCRGMNIERSYDDRHVEKPGWRPRLELLALCCDCESTWTEIYAVTWQVVTYEDLDDRRIEE